MTDKSSGFEHYLNHLKSISPLGRCYKRLVSSPILFSSARYFGSRIIEVGSGTGSGVLGAFPTRVVGLEINPLAVEFSRSIGLQVSLIGENGIFPVKDGDFDACILDNVLEHIEEPRQTLDECYRITGPRGGLVIAVPGLCGYRSDSDHKVFYGEAEVRALDDRWSLNALFSLPTIFRSGRVSNLIRQYCLVAVYGKKH